MEPLVLRIRAPLRREDLPGLFAKTCALLEEHDPTQVVCDVSAFPPDAVAVDALARLTLACRRRHCRLELRGAHPRLSELLALTGLSEVF
jgi:ABC-type transporter Mla MlaB component